MAPQAVIKINGIDSRFAAVAIGSTVNLSNHDAGGEASYAWQIVDQPVGTADTLSSTGIENVSFTPTKEGSYEIKLTVDAALATVAVQTAIVTVLDARTGERVPAATETLESGVQGWALAIKRILSRALRSSVDNNVILAQTPGGITVGSIVTLTGAVVVNAGTQAVFTVPGMAAALATATHRERLGVLVDGVASGIVTVGTLALVRTFGLVPTAGTGSPAVGDPVFLSDAGLPALTAGTFSRTIGRVVASAAGSYQWVIDSGVIDAGVTVAGRFLAQQILTGSGTYTPTAGTTRVRVRMIGGGGGGGGAGGGGSSAAGAGGGSGVPLEFTAGVAGTAITGGAFVCGAAGTGGANTGGTGGTGGDTTLVVGGVTFTAKGSTGGGGLASSTLATAFGGIGQAGTSSGAGIIGPSLGRRGNMGLVTSATASFAGAGGSVDPFGTGGAPAAQGQPGGAAAGFGAGGGGANATAAGQTGGAATAGYIVIDEES